LRQIQSLGILGSGWATYGAAGVLRDFLKWAPYGAAGAQRVNHEMERGGPQTFRWANDAIFEHYINFSFGGCFLFWVQLAWPLKLWGYFGDDVMLDSGLEVRLGWWWGGSVR